MGTIKDLADVAWRDYEIMHAPSSGNHEPNKVDIRATLTEVDTLVTGSDGASGLAAVSAAEAAASAATAAASAAEANAIAASGVPSGLFSFQTLGIPGPAVTGSALGDATYVYFDKVLEDGTITSIDVFGIAGGGTIQVKRFSLAAGTLTQVGSDYPVVIAAGAQTLDATDYGIIPVLAGEHIGLYANSEVSNTVEDSLSGGRYTASGNVSSMAASGAPSITNRMQIGFHISSLYGDTARVLDMEEAQRELSPLLTRKLDFNEVHEQVIGTSEPVTGSLTGGNSVYVFYTQAVARSFLKRVWIYCEAGRITIRRWSRAGDVNTIVGSPLILEAAAGLNEFDADAGDFVPFLVETGERLSIYTQNELHYNNDTGLGGGYFSSGGTGTEEFTDATLSGNLQLQVGFGLEILTPRRSASVMPGEQLATDDSVTLERDMWCLLMAFGQSLALGTAGTEFLYTTIYSNIMFAQGIRASKAGSLQGVSSAGGTATVVAAAENAVENTAGDNDRENTGFVAMADRIAFLSARDRGIPPASTVVFPFSAAHGADSIIAINSNATWWQVAVDQLDEARARADEAGVIAKAPVCILRIGHTDASDNTLSIPVFKAHILRYMKDINALIRSKLDQTDQPHWLVQQPSSYITGTANSILRDGRFQQALLDICMETSWAHCVGGDYPYPNSSIHLDAYGYTMDGFREAMAHHEIVRFGRRPRTILPLGAYWTGTSVVLRLWSVDALEYDTALVTAATRKGFGIMVNAALATIAADGTINNAPADALSPYIREISFTLSGAPTTGDDVQVRYGMDYSVSTRSSGAGGNLRSSWSETHTINAVAKTVCMWAPHFKVDALEV